MYWPREGSMVTQVVPAAAAKLLPAMADRLPVAWLMVTWLMLPEL